MLANLGWIHIVILGGIVLLLFGAKRFPEIGKSLGQGINNLYRGVTGKDNETPALPPPSDSHTNKLSQ